MNIVILDGYTLNPGDLSWDWLNDYGRYTAYDRTPADKVKERIEEADIVFTNKTTISREDLQGSKVRFISVLATGYNIVDIDAAREMSIPVSNVPTYGTKTVAQFTTAMLLELCHHIGAHSTSVFQGDWSRHDDFCYTLYPQIELVGKTLGLYGLGRIGLAFAKIAEALGMEIIYHSRTKKDLPYTYVSLEDLFKQSDVLSLHSPLTEETEGVINKKHLSMMKSTALLLNSSRGQLVVEEDLVDALNHGVIAGAALDVVRIEPMEENSPLLKAKNLIITPHIAWSTTEARIRIMNTTKENLDAFLKGEPVHVV